MKLHRRQPQYLLKPRLGTLSAPPRFLVYGNQTIDQAWGKVNPAIELYGQTDYEHQFGISVTRAVQSVAGAGWVTPARLLYGKPHTVITRFSSTYTGTFNAPDDYGNLIGTFYGGTWGWALRITDNKYLKWVCIPAGGGTASVTVPSWQFSLKNDGFHTYAFTHTGQTNGSAQVQLFIDGIRMWVLNNAASPYDAAGAQWDGVGGPNSLYTGRSGYSYNGGIDGWYEYSAIFHAVLTDFEIAQLSVPSNFYGLTLEQNPKRVWLQLSPDEQPPLITSIAGDGAWFGGGL
jgi:hypothetical protein